VIHVNGPNTFVKAHTLVDWSGCPRLKNTKGPKRLLSASCSAEIPTTLRKKSRLLTDRYCAHMRDARREKAKNCPKLLTVSRHICECFSRRAQLNENSPPPKNYASTSHVLLKKFARYENIFRYFQSAWSLLRQFQRTEFPINPTAT
jgi:hypothetical protein